MTQQQIYKKKSYTQIFILYLTYLYNVLFKTNFDNFFLSYFCFTILYNRYDELFIKKTFTNQTLELLQHFYTLVCLKDAKNIYKVSESYWNLHSLNKMSLLYWENITISFHTKRLYKLFCISFQFHHVSGRATMEIASNNPSCEEDFVLSISKKFHKV